jgi:hypothetical protein
MKTASRLILFRNFVGRTGGQGLLARLMGAETQIFGE